MRFLAGEKLQLFIRNTKDSLPRMIFNKMSEPEVCNFSTKEALDERPYRISLQSASLAEKSRFGKLSKDLIHPSTNRRLQDGFRSGS